MKRKRRKKKKDFSKFIVLLVIILNIAFTLKVFNVFLMTGNEPSSLVVAWFGFTTVELWSLSRIKINKNKNDENTDLDVG